eukprot:6193747-Pleurochrysis_carterae.AAC.5
MCTLPAGSVGTLVVPTAEALSAAFKLGEGERQRLKTCAATRLLPKAMNVTVARILCKSAWQLTGAEDATLQVRRRSSTCARFKGYVARASDGNFNEPNLSCAYAQRARPVVCKHVHLQMHCCRITAACMMQECMRFTKHTQCTDKHVTHGQSLLNSEPSRAWLGACGVGSRDFAGRASPPRSLPTT